MSVIFCVMIRCGLGDYQGLDFHDLTCFFYVYYVMPLNKLVTEI
jgi:hypothetical protein